MSVPMWRLDADDIALWNSEFDRAGIALHLNLISPACAAQPGSWTNEYITAGNGTVKLLRNSAKELGFSCS